VTRALRLLPFAVGAIVATLRADAVEFRAQAAGAWVENISRTSFAPTAQDAMTATVDVSVVHARQLTSRLTAIGGFEAGFEQVPDFSALNQVHAGFRGALRAKFGLGPLAPTVEAGVGLSRQSFREDGRTGWRQEGTIRVAKRLTERLRLSAFATWDSFTASAAPFDVHSRRLGVEATWDFADRWTITAGGARLRGQVVANAAWPIWGQALGGELGAVVRDYYSTVPWRTTDTFGSGWVAYRVDATADLLWGEASFLLGDRTRLFLRQETVKVINRIDVRYDTEFWSLGLAHRF